MNVSSDSPSPEPWISDLVARIKASPRRTEALADPAAFLAGRRFHRSFICQRTHRRVTYADVGDEAGPTVVFFAPSFCTRYLGTSVDIPALELGVRVIVIDRPGCGGIDKCPLNERVQISAAMMESLVELLNLESFAMMSFSSGTIHMLEYLRLYPRHLSMPNLTLLFVSPWFPGNIYLPLIPAPLISMEHVLIPAIQSTIQLTVNTLSRPISVMVQKLPGFVLKSTPTDGKRTQSKNTTTVKPASELTKLTESLMGPESATYYSMAMKYCWAEGMQGMSQEHLLCLGKGVHGRGVDKPGSKAWYEACLKGIAQPRSANSGDSVPKVAFHVWWGEKDDMVPQSARDAFDAMVKAAGLELCRRTLPDAGHEPPMLCAEGVGDALRTAANNLANCKPTLHQPDEGS